MSDSGTVGAIGMTVLLKFDCAHAIRLNKMERLGGASRRTSGRSSVASTVPAEIRVCCRVRPRSNNTDDAVSVTLNDDTVTLICHDAAKGTRSE